ncbi:MAG: LLM class flavin-dependent oxidoreductase, partial [Ilumatobacter sp.]
ITGLMADGPFSFDGDHYTIRDHDGFPKPVQRPRPPVIIGGGGPRVLGLAAREADIVGVNGTLHAGVIGPDAIATMTRDAVVDKVAIVADAARTAGRLDHIEMNIRTFFGSVTDDRDTQVDALSAMIGVDPRMISESPFALVGDADEICDTLVARREEFGFSYVIVGAGEIDDFAPVVARLAGT